MAGGSDPQSPAPTWQRWSDPQSPAPTWQRWSDPQSPASTWQKRSESQPSSSTWQKGQSRNLLPLTGRRMRPATSCLYLAQGSDPQPPASTWQNTVKKAVELLDGPSKNTLLKSNKYNSKGEIVYLDTHVFFSPLCYRMRKFDMREVQ